MSAYEKLPKKRCIIQKLDFENCIVSSIKTKSRIRKKLRARITREVETIDDGQDDSQPDDVSFSTSSVLTNAEEESSPEIVKKQIRGDESPVFFKKKKLSKEVKDYEESAISQNSVCSPTSPVFKLRVNKPLSGGKSQEERKSMEKTTSHELFVEGTSSSCEQSSYQIEDFTQESKHSVVISSVESQEVKNQSSGDYSVDCKSNSIKGLSISSQKHESDPLTKWLEAKEMNDGMENVKKKYKKNSLLDRLQKVLQKQASEKLLWQHQNLKTFCLKLVVEDFWSEEFRFILKCRTLESESDISFLIVDSKWVPDVQEIQEGSVLQLYPPWQKLTIEKPMLTVLLNIICLDVLDEIKEITVKTVKHEHLSAEEFETNPALFINSLFSFRFSELLL